MLIRSQKEQIEMRQQKQTLFLFIYTTTTKFSRSLTMNEDLLI